MKNLFSHKSKKSPLPWRGFRRGFPTKLSPSFGGIKGGFLIIFILFFSSFTYSQKFNKTYKYPSSDYQGRGMLMVETLDSALVTVTFQQNIGGNYSVYLTKIDLEGEIIWSKIIMYEPAVFEEWDIIAHSDGYYYIVGNTFDSKIIKVNV